MKKIFLFVACASIMVMGAKAQSAEELYNAGKAEFAKYDKLFGEYQLAHSQNENAPDPTIGERATALMNGFELLQQALPLDTIIEKNKDGSPKIDKKTGKPKFKTKYSKDIVNLLTGHINDVLNVGNAGLMGNDYATSFKAFNFFNQLVNSSLVKDIPFDQATLGEVAFYEGYSAFQIKNYNAAFKAFSSALAKGYTENQTEDFKNASVANIVQGYCDSKQYNEAITYVDNAITLEPTSALLYDMKGFIVEQKDGLNAAEALYKKATELDPSFPNGFYDLGRVIYDRAEKIIEQNPNKTSKELAPTLVPLYNEALPLFKKAKELDADGSKTEASKFIDAIEYQLELLR